MFGAFLIMYWGLALGIVHYRLFSIEQWWHAIMAWFVGGLCVLLLDIVLIVGLALPQDMALSLAVALTGWLYFPLRQFLWDKFGHRQTLEISDWLPEVLPTLMPAEDIHQSHAWQNSLRRVWHALDVKQVSGALAKPEIVDDGLTLNVPDISDDSGYHYRIHCASAGQRLFTQRDIQSFFSLQKISVLVLQITEARTLGAQQERQRIRRDIHDDMGAQLLTLLHSCPTNLQPLVRDLLQATRELVQTLNLHAVDSLTASDAWQAEAEQRCKAAGVKLQWNYYPDALPRKLSARAHVNLTRILREAISNALKHAMPSQITINLQTSGECSEITVSDNGRMGHDSSWVEGNGCRIIRQRVEEIDGELEWKTDQGCTLCIRLPVV
jgi:signal transduction histidine kinase